MNMLTIALLSLIYVAVNGVLFFQRGGGIFDINLWLKNKLPTFLRWLALRNLIWVALFELPLLTFALLYCFGFDTTVSLWYCLAIAVGYVTSFVAGWGSYFDMGTYPLEYVNHREIGWIDWILFKLYGPLWYPLSAQNQVEPTYDLVVSPTGQLRPYEWRYKRDATGMIIRMLYAYALVACVCIATWYSFGFVHWYAILLGVVMMPVLGLLYAFFGSQKGYLDFSVATNLGKTGWQGLAPTQKAEITSGLVLGTYLVLVFVDLAKQ